MSEIHIGKEIERRYQMSGLKLAEFANRLNTGKRNVYSIFERPEISTTQLRKISEVLQFDFFKLYTTPDVGAGQATTDDLKFNPAKVTVLVELDGTQSTVDKWVAKLNAINVAVR